MTMAGAKTTKSPRLGSSILATVSTRLDRSALATVPRLKFMADDRRDCRWPLLGGSIRIALPPSTYRRIRVSVTAGVESGCSTPGHRLPLISRLEKDNRAG